MSDFKKFFNSFPRGLWFVMVVIIIIICALPALLTMPGVIHFSDTGQIGDTIGGIMGPFIAIIAAFLTFFAFWVQFEANRELIKENHRSHFENRFYKMLDIHLDNVVFLNKENKDENTDSCFHNWCHDIRNLFDYLSSEGDFGGFISTIMEDYKEEETQKDFLIFLSHIQSSKNEYYKIIFDITYAYFYANNIASIRYQNNKKTHHVIQFASLFSAYLSDLNQEEINGSDKTEILGRYYRHLFQIVKYVDEQAEDLFDDKDWKSGYLNILRSQMSEYEQLLLYYNSQSTYGKAWDDSHYVEKYKLIKNIPYNRINTCAGISPSQRYEEEIEESEKIGDPFFDRM